MIILTYSSILHWIEEPTPGCTEMEVVDVDDDGDLDLVGCRFYTDCVYLWENLDGAGLSWSRTTLADSLHYTSTIDASDIDLDGDSDFFVSSNYGSYWIEDAEGSWVKHLVSTQPSHCIRLCDTDGDGDQDLLASWGTGGCWFENLDGYGSSWQQRTIWSSGYHAECIRPGDFDGDGDIDAVISINGTPAVVWYENVDGAGGTWTSHTVCSTIGGTYTLIPYGLEAIDLDLDGDVDILVAGNNPLPEGRAIWIENMNGLGTSWLKRPVDSDLLGACSMDAADFDEDGDLDIIVTAAAASWEDDHLVSWYENIDGEALVLNEHVVDPDRAAGDATGADIDGDGTLDLIAVSPPRWYNFSRSTSGWLESSILDPPGGSQILWTDLSWEATVPSGTTLTFQVRASSDAADMGEWSPEISTPGNISAYLPDPCYYFQYRVNMATSTPPTTPMLDELLVQWNPVGIEGQPEADEPTLTVLSGNPSPGTVILDVYTPEAGLADLRIYDIAGRLVEEPMAGQIEAGHHQLTVTDLPTGCYRAVMTTNGFSTEARLTVLRQ